MFREKIYCKYCGFKLENHATILSYDEYTGKPIDGPVLVKCSNANCVTTNYYRAIINKYGR